MAGVACCIPPPPTKYVPEGKEEELIPGLSVYVNWPDSATSAVIFASDIHGANNPLLRRIADKAAAAGYVGLVPDFFHGDPFIPRPGVGFGPWLNEWIKIHPPAGSVDETRNLIKELKSRGITSLGFSGFCWGGRLAIEVERVEDLNAAVLLHPGPVKSEVFKDVRAPIAILAGELDTVLPPELVKEYSAVLASTNKVQSFVKIYPGTAHGWTLRYEESDEAAVKVADESHDDMLNWYKKHLLQQHSSA